MKNILSLLLALTIVFSLCACGTSSKKNIEDINATIEELSLKETLTQEEVNNLMEKYNDLTEKDRSKISEDELNKAIELRTPEKIAISVAETIKRTMKSSASFKVLEDVKVREGDKNSLFPYYVMIEYSGQNSFGGTVDNVSCLRVADNYSAPSLELAFLTGAFERVLNSTEAYSEYTKSKGKEYLVDAERVMENIEVPVRIEK